MVQVVLQETSELGVDYIFDDAGQTGDSCTLLLFVVVHSLKFCFLRVCFFRRANFLCCLGVSCGSSSNLLLGGLFLYTANLNLALFLLCTAASS